MSRIIVLLVAGIEQADDMMRLWESVEARLSFSEIYYSVERMTLA